MNVGLSNIVEFPAVDANLQPPVKDENLSVIILTAEERDESLVRDILNEACQHKTQVISGSMDKLSKVCDKEQLSIVVMRDLILRQEPGHLEAVLKKIPDHTSVLILSDEIEENESNKYLATGARDVISLENPDHLRSVVMREFGNLLVHKALARAQSDSSNFQRQVKRLTNSPALGIADLRHGSIVRANRAWLELFGCNGVEQILNTPFLDLVNPSHRAKVKQTLAERQSGQRRGDVLKTSGRSLAGAETPLNLTLERVRVSGLSTVRITAWPDSGSANAKDANLDAAAQIYDRAMFLRQLEKRLSSPLEGGVRALAYIRPDRFSQVQESTGFLGSEQVLAHLAGMLAQLAHPADLYGRFGGTVFTVLLERGCIRDVEAWLKHFCKMVADSPFDDEGTAVELTCTAGVCQAADSTMTIEKLLQEAHDACHQGRLKGGGEVSLGASTEATRNEQKHAVKEANRIRSALRSNRFKLVCGPIIKLDNSSCKLRDTWVRMVAEDGGLILPAEFMQIAESHNLMTMIDRWVIAESLTYCAKRAPDLFFVQLSQDSVVDDTLGKWLKSVLEKPGANASQICFQTTEVNASQFLKQTIQQAKGLIKMGFRFAIDQLGITPDTMDILQNVPMQFARVDAALMQGVARDRSVEREVAKIVNAAKERGIQTIGNRIEDATTMAASCKIGIDYAQGDFVRHDPIVLEDTDTMCLPNL